MKIRIQYTIDDDTICGLLCSAMEGGSNYWMRVAGCEWPGDEPNQTAWSSSQAAPVLKNGVTRIDDRVEDKEHRLDRKAIERGLCTMARHYPQHFADALRESGDATTGDVFLQCCLFGKVIYG
jgi:hypothetical protein